MAINHETILILAEIEHFSPLFKANFEPTESLFKLDT